MERRKGDGKVKWMSEKDEPDVGTITRENYGRTLTVDIYIQTDTHRQTEHLSIPNDELKASYSELLRLYKKKK